MYLIYFSFRESRSKLTLFHTFLVIKGEILGAAALAAAA